MSWISRFLLAAASLLMACDPGYTYHPDDWQPLEKGYSWKKSLDGIEVNIYTMGGLVGSRSLVVSLMLTNRTDTLLVLEGAELIVQDHQTLMAGLPGSGDLRWRSVSPNESKSIGLYWDFNQPVMDVLGKHPRMVVHLRQGDRTERLEIRYTRVE